MGEATYLDQIPDLDLSVSPAEDIKVVVGRLDFTKEINLMGRLALLNALEGIIKVVNLRDKNASRKVPM